MDTNSQRQEHRDGTLSLLNAAIEAVNLAKELSGMTPAKAVFGSVSVLLTMIRDSMANKADYVELGLACADVCRALDRGMNGKKLDHLSLSVCEAIAQLTATVAEIRRKVAKQNGRNGVSRLFHAKGDGGTIAAWKLDLNRILHVFNTELAMNAHVTISEIRHDVSKIREGIECQVRSVRTSVLGEPPPPPPRACFGRDELIERVVGLAENITPIALIGPGGIGKTSIALTVLHHGRVKERFGDNRWFIRCDQFPASRTHFLGRLSEVIGAGVENPEDLAPVRPFLSSREMVIVLDNAESILDPQGKNAPEIYATVEELSQFNNVCLCITSRISTIPLDCETLNIPTLPMEAARDAFYRICKSNERSGLVDEILERLDFHPLSITLLATVAHHNRWDNGRLTREWEQRRTSVLQTEHNRSFAAAIELSLASPMFQNLGPSARGLLGVVAFFPQGVNENNLDWLFPTLSNKTKIFDNFCILSLTYRSNGFVTMLAPLRDYLCPSYPSSPPLLRTAMECYFDRLSVRVEPGKPGFEEARWVTSEDANVERLLDVFTTIDAGSDDIWDVCQCFMEHLFWHKPRLVVLGPKVEGLPDDHRFKPGCLFQLSQLFHSVGNQVERKRLLTHSLKLWRERGNNSEVAETLRFLSDANRLLGLNKKGIPQAKEALEIYEQLDNISGQAWSWQQLARLLCCDNQPDAAEEATLRAIHLLPDQGEEFLICKCYRLLGYIYSSRGKTDEAIDHFGTTLRVASSFNWHHEQFWAHCSLAALFFGKKRFEDAHIHVERAKSHAVDDAYKLGLTMVLQAKLWYKERRFEEARFEALAAADVFEKLGIVKDVEVCRTILQSIDEAIKKLVASRESEFNARGARHHLTSFAFGQTFQS